MNQSDCKNIASEKAAGCAKGSSPGTEDFRVKTHELNDIKRVIGVVSGKGGVGKSLITSMLAVQTKRKGYRVGVLDADVTGPSIPKMFGISKRVKGSELGVYPERTSGDIKIMSANLLLEKEDLPVIWRGPIVSDLVRQFWSDVIWGKIDYLFLDMPPGTGDVPLTVFQAIPLDGVIIVTSPQDLVHLIVRKSYNMAKTMEIPVLGVVENMSYIMCPDCGKEIKMFGDSRIEKIASELGIKMLGTIPVDPVVAELCDRGEVEEIKEDFLSEAVSFLEDAFRTSGSDQKKK